jgi:putative Holliday junction resolvase
MIATGFDTLARKKFAVDAGRLLDLVAQHDVGGLVIGLPWNLDGSEGPRAQSVRAFAANLARLTPIPMLLWDERLTTVAAERALLEADASRRQRDRVIDKVAATLILQGALDRMARL